MLKFMGPFFSRFFSYNQVSGSLHERLISSLGGVLGIWLIYISSLWLNGEAHALVIASMGASAVLLFAVPHGALSQPWPLMGGHLLSALIGVSCVLLVDNLALCAALAVGVSIGVMYSLRCLHPPGGATALTAVVGGSQIQALGYTYVLNPILLNALVILVVALAFNNLFKSRRYPALLFHQEKPEKKEIDHEHLIFALKKMDTFIDVSEDDLMQIYTLATQHANQGLNPEDIVLGNYYSNGEYGLGWSIRQVIDESGEPGEKDQIIYKIVAGQGRRTSGMVSRQEFAQWAKYIMERDDENWKRKANR